MLRTTQLCAIVALAASTTLTAGNHPGKHDIVDTAVGAGQFETLATALKAAELIDALKGEGPFTVFAPTDDAFGALPDGTISSLLERENRGKLQTILTYHVVPGRVTAADVVKLNNATTLSGQRVGIEVSGGKVMVGGANVVKTDIECSNGVIHVIDAVLLPETGSLAAVGRKAGKFKTLIAAAQAAGLTSAFLGDDDLTVFAPTDEAFAKIDDATLASLLEPKNRSKLEAILKYHVVPGRIFAEQAAAAGTAKTLQGSAVRISIRDGRLQINDSAVTKTDIQARNGVIHVIDTVLMPDLPEKKRGRKLFGISYQAPSAALASQLEIDRHKTLVVTAITRGSAAEAAGLQRHDVITEVDGRSGTDSNVSRAKKDRDYGEEVEFQIVRRGKHATLAIEIGEARH